MIGTPGVKWGDAEKAQWLSQQSVKRSYQDEVLSKLEPLRDHFDIEQYGSLSYDTEKYPLYAVKTRNWTADRPTVLVTGGVHGYETSGVQGAVRFLQTSALQYSDRFNIVVAPCVSPWGYETINRWNPLAIDPNRSFIGEGGTEESSALIRYVATLRTNPVVNIIAHFDLHETTDTDNTTFRPARAARDAIEITCWNIPDGFYTVGNSENPQPEFQKAVIEGVSKVTHVAEADEDGRLIGEKIQQFGVINYPCRELGLCMSLTGAQYVTTTEVYPDSPRVTDEICAEAQVAVITSGLDFILRKG
eukprot:CAMPEP_0185035550 /NCGR_PEP_ID=MMETSP1103-20130426/27143_1 /TAXON_ID=36769 /ORGANISM="Paraphysomonas bandaiensis, Strain Caron Lab Isolate" /LENGTH=303 /DNA_ID=CAMNT_0027572685 /DNA_START=8 /DNA_END=919 /DNA_ORIENTATION=-